MSGFGNGKAASSLKRGAPAQNEPAVVVGKAGTGGIYIGDLDPNRITFGELRKGPRDSYCPLLLDGVERILILQLAPDPSEPVRQPFKAGPFVEKDPTSKNFDKPKDKNWTMCLEMNEASRAKIQEIERRAQEHIKSLKSSQDFMSIGKMYRNTDHKTGDHTPVSDAAMPAWNSAIKFSKDPEARKKFPPTLRIRVQHEEDPDNSNRRPPLVQKAAIYEKHNQISKRQTGSVWDLAQPSVVQVPTIRMVRGPYLGNLGTGITWTLESTLILTNKSGKAEAETNIGGFEELDETEEEINAKLGPGSVGAFEGPSDPTCSPDANDA